MKGLQIGHLEQSMDYKISKASTKFRFGMSDPNQLEDWLRAENVIGVSMIGRSNVGKSSSINSLFGNKTANISKTPGRTREINIFEFKLELNGKPVEDGPTYWLFDLPGYGHAKVSKEMKSHWQKLMHTFFENAGDDVLMLNLQDARHPNQDSDKEFKKYLEPYGFNTFMVFNKLDKLKTQKERSALNKLKPQIYKESDWVEQVHFVSAEKKTGIPTLETSVVNFLLNQTQQRSS